MTSMNEMTHEEIFKNYEDLGYIIFPMKNNTKGVPKLPFCKGWQDLEKSYQWRKPPTKYEQKMTTGSAIQTGRRSNLTILDIDILKAGESSKDGMDYFINNLKDIKTKIVKTRSGGMHMYFNYCEDVKTTTKVQSYSIDIRSDGACVVCPPTPEYEFINDYEAIDMPQFLIDFINKKKEETRGRKKKVYDVKTIIEENNNNEFFIIDIEELKQIKNVVEILSEYSNNYKDWMTITYALKSCVFNNSAIIESQIIEIWEDFSIKSSLYDSVENFKIWDSINKTYVDINYLFYIAKLDFKITKTIKYVDIENIKKYKNVIEDDKNQYLDLQGYENKYKTILVKSPTGSGKSVQSLKMINTIVKNDPKIKILSIVSRKSLKDAQLNLFNNELNENYKKTWLDHLHDDEIKSDEFPENCKNKIDYENWINDHHQNLSNYITTSVYGKIYGSVSIDKIENLDDCKKWYKNDRLLLAKCKEDVKERDFQDYSIYLQQYEDFINDEEKRQELFIKNKNKYHNMQDYEKIKNYNVNKLIIQLDSLGKLKAENFDGCVLYLDELNSLICHMVSSSTMKNKRIDVYRNIAHIIKHCSVLIGVDADLSSPIIDFVLKFREEEKTIIYNNTYQNYKGVKAYCFDSYELTKQHIFNNIYSEKSFPIIAVDSKSELEVIYEELKQKFKEISEEKYNYFIKNSLIYTRSEGSSTDLQNVNEKWANKIVFYSPRVLYGIDFKSEKKETVYIISVSGDTDPLTNSYRDHTLNAAEIAQQMNRNRNISQVKYYIRSNNCGLKGIHTIDEIKKENTAFLNGYTSMYNKLTNNINDYTIDDDGKIKINDSLINRLFYKNEWKNHILNSAKRYHFEQILLKKGFVINRIYDDEEYDNTILKNKLKITKQEILTNTEEINDDIIDKITLNKISEIDPKYIKRKEELINNVKILNLIDMDGRYDIENIDRFKNVICNDNDFKEHLNLRTLIANNEKIKQLLYNSKNKDFDIHQCKSVLTKIACIRDVEKYINIHPFQIVNKNDDEEADKEFEIINNFKFICKLFRIQIKNNPKTKYEYYKLLVVKMYNNVCNNIIESTIIRTYNKKKDRTDIKKDHTTNYQYNLNEKKIKKFFELYYFSNMDFFNVDVNIIKIYKNIDIADDYVPKIKDNQEEEQHIIYDVCDCGIKLINLCDCHIKKYKTCDLNGEFICMNCNKWGCRCTEELICAKEELICDKEELICTDCNKQGFIYSIKYKNDKEIQHICTKCSKRGCLFFTKYTIQEKEKEINKNKEWYEDREEPNKKEIIIIENKIIKHDNFESMMDTSTDVIEYKTNFLMFFDNDETLINAYKYILECETDIYRSNKIIFFTDNKINLYNTIYNFDNGINIKINVNNPNEWKNNVLLCSSKNKTLNIIEKYNTDIPQNIYFINTDENYIKSNVFTDTISENKNFDFINYCIKT